MKGIVGFEELMIYDNRIHELLRKRFCLQMVFWSYFAILCFS